MLPATAIDAGLCRWRARETAEAVGTMIVDRAMYRDGRRTAELLELGHMDDAFRAGGGLAWVGLYRPTEQEFAAIAAEFGLHELAVEDAVHPHQRPKLERRYGDTLFCVLRPARYVDKTETVEFSEVHVFAGPHFVVTVRHGEGPDIAAVRRALESRPDLLRRGPVAIVHAIVERVLDDYGPVVAGVENDIEEIEDEVFNGSPGAPRRVYELSREVIAFQRATKPLPPMLERLLDDRSLDEDERRYLRDMQDHALRVVEQADGFRQLLQNILSVNLTLETKSLAEMSNALTEMSNDQNEEVKKISAWAAILFAPTLVGTAYGMNFENMPGLTWDLGYPLALALMVLLGVALYLLFKRRKWI